MSKNFEKQKNKNNEILVVSTVISIEQQNIPTGENIKNVFYLKSEQYPKTGRMCILWGGYTFQAGDEVVCKGRIDERGVFLARWLTVIKKAGSKIENNGKESFNTLREFNNKFPTKMYTCSRCKSLVANPYYCTVCKNQSNNILLTQDTYAYTIKENNTDEMIFKPIELEKEK